MDFVSPAHDKQDFERTDMFLRLEAKLKQLTTDITVFKKESRGIKNPPINPKKSTNLELIFDN